MRRKCNYKIVEGMDGFMRYGSEVFAKGLKVGCYGCYFWLFRGRIKKKSRSRRVKF